MARELVVPYCGSPPDPADLMARWNLDPVLIAALLSVWAWYVVLKRPRRSARAWCFHAGWVLTALLLICPLCPLSVALFSARVGQHMLLTMVAAPLVALGLGQPESARGGLGRSPIAAAAVFAAALWYWHAPEPYDLTFQSTLIYWLMHLSLYGSSLWLWRTLLAGGQALAQTVAASAITAAAMGLLAAAITFTGRPLYAPHALTTLAWGMTPLADQQLGGAVMWAPAGVILVGALVFSLATAMRRSEQTAYGEAVVGGL